MEMTGQRALSFSAASVVEEVLQQHDPRSRDLDLEYRRAEEAGMRRNEAAEWLRNLVGVAAWKDLPAEPSEEEFRLGLTSGIILCNALNKVQPGAVFKVVDSPCDVALIPDGAALSAFQYFENVRNFLVGISELGLPTFEASDLEQGGKSARVVNTILALKSYSQWKQTGGNGIWKFGGSVKPSISSKPFLRKNSEPFTGSLFSTSSAGERASNNAVDGRPECNTTLNGHIGVLVRTLLSDKRPDEIPKIVESVLGKVAEQFEHRLLKQRDMVNTNCNGSEATKISKDMMNFPSTTNRDDSCQNEYGKSSLRQRIIFDEQQKHVEDFKRSLRTTKSDLQFLQEKFREEFNNLGMHIKGLTHAASSYHKVLEENRKLYNQVQDLKGSIRVYCRVRPFLPGQSNSLTSVNHIGESIIAIKTSSKYGNGLKSFNFNQVFGPSSTQEEVFSDMQPLVRSVLDGFNVCIFAYGQTGSGKTYTMTGPKDLTEKSLGVNFRALSDLFLLAEQRKDIMCYNVSVQMIEIYNEQVRDLLVTEGGTKRLEIRNSSHTGFSVPDANLIPASSTADVIDIMNLGQRNRAVGATALNDRSSRSHSCLTVHVQGKDLRSGTILRGCMHLVDLAGSERVDKSEVTGDRLKEAQHINKSLSALGDVIAALAQKNPHVPYRNSKLTQLLQDSLGGQAKTLMFVHISPEPDAVGETISTLKFAERVATVELGAAKVNKDNPDVKELKEQIASLKAALSLREQDSLPCLELDKFEQQCANESSSPFNCRQQLAQTTSRTNRQPMGEVGNIEISRKDVLEDQTTNSPCPLITPIKRCSEDNGMGGEWVDKKQSSKRVVDRFPVCWEPENRDLAEKMLQNVSPEAPSPTNRFNFSSNCDTDFDTGTSDSSDHHPLWHLSHTKHSSATKASGSLSHTGRFKTMKNSRNRNPRGGGPSPSSKVQGGVRDPPHRKPTSKDALQCKNIHRG